MRILQINKYSYPKGGADKYYLSLSRALQELGHQIYLFSMSRPRKLYRHVFWSSSANNILNRIIQEFKPDVAHLHNIYHDFSPSILYILKQYHVPVVMTLHDYKIICPNYRLYTQGKVCEKCKKYKYYQCFLRQCLKNSYLLSLAGALEAYLHQMILQSYERNINLYISPSQFLKNKFREWGVRKKIVHLPNFVEVKKRNVKKENYLLYLGRLEREKGIATLLAAMQKLPEEALYIAGEGSFKIKETANVKYLGFVNNPDELVAKAKLLIVPSLWPENNPLSILEAQALGTPVLASRVGGIPEITKNLFTPSDAGDLAKKIKEKNKTEKLIISKEEHLARIIEIYKNCLP